MFWRCFVSDDIDMVKSSSDVELLPTTRQRQKVASGEIAKDVKMTTSQSFSEFAWSALRDLSVPQALESSQTYIQSHLKNYNTVYSLQPPSARHRKHQSGGDVVWPLMSPSNSRPRHRHSSVDSRPESDSITSDSSMSKSLLDNILDDYDKMLMNRSTDDGFSALSQNVLSARRGRKPRNDELIIGEGNPMEMTAHIISTDDGMCQLACDSMNISKCNAIETDHQGQYNSEDTDGEGDEGCVRLEEMHKLENQRMLHHFNQQVLQANVTPSFVFSVNQQ